MVQVDFFRVGSCCHPNWITLQGGGWRTANFPALAVLLRHPSHGLFLFDTGYSSHFATATAHFPENLYRMITPVKFSPQDDLVSQLAHMGITPQEIRGIFISHFHADHVAALRDFPRATFYALHEAYLHIAPLGRIAALRRAFLPSLLPNDFLSRFQAVDTLCPARALPQSAHPFTEGFDIFGDGSVFVVPLAGHARGQMGLWLQGTDPATFLVADSCWSSLAYEQNIPPSWLSFLIHDNRKAYLHTLQRLHELSQYNPDVLIMPSHCEHKIGLFAHPQTSMPPCNHHI